MPRGRAVVARGQRFESSRHIGPFPPVALVSQLIDSVDAVGIEHLEIVSCFVGVVFEFALPPDEGRAQEGLQLVAIRNLVIAQIICSSSFLRRLLAISAGYGVGLVVLTARRRRKGVDVAQGWPQD
jgi:hypothetical protein